MQFRFGDHVLDVGRRELLRGGAPVPLEPQVFDLLEYLIRNRDRVLTRDDLIDAVWGGRIVSDSTVTAGSMPPARPSATAAGPSP